MFIYAQRDGKYLKNFKNKYFRNNIEQATLHALPFYLKSFSLFPKGNDMMMRLFSKDNLCYAIIGSALKYSLLTQFVEPISLLMTSVHTVTRHTRFVLHCC